MGKVELPECDQWLTGVWRRISPEAKIAFGYAFIAGMLTHLYMFTGKYPNHDEILNLYSANNAAGFGRWLMHWASFLSSDSSVPMVNGVFSILAVAFACALTVRVLRMEKRTQIAVTALLMVGFPTVANTFTWMSCADGFLNALALAVLGVYVTDRYRRGFVWGCVLFILSLMIYQAQICMAIALMATRYLQLLLEKERTDREMLAVLGRYGAALVFGVGLYILLARFLLPGLTGQELFVHAGIESMGSLPLSEIPARLYTAYYEFAQYMLRTSMLTSWRFVRYLHLLIGGLEVFLTLFILLRTPKKSVMQTVFAVMILALIPVLYGAIYLMGVTDRSTYYLLIYSYVMFYILLFVLYNGLQRSYGQKPGPGRRWFPNAVGYAVTGMALLSGIVYAVNSNEVYLALQLKYENTYALSNRVVQSVEQYPGYTTETPVYVAGSFNRANYPASKEGVFWALGRHSGLQGASEYNLIATDKLFRAFARDYLGVLLIKPEPEQIQQVEASHALAEMPCYPYAGSVELIGGVLVVKASNLED